MNATSITDRHHIIRLMSEGMTAGEVHGLLRIQTSTISRICKRCKDTGEIAPRKGRAGRKSCFSAGQTPKIETMLKEQCDCTLQEIKDKPGLDCSLAALCSLINKKLHFNRKKNDSPEGRPLTGSD